MHHWAGLGDCRYSKEKTLRLLDDTAKKRIIDTDVLIIDEIGMISAEVFKKLEYVMRNVKACNKIFGGVQVGTFTPDEQCLRFCPKRPWTKNKWKIFTTSHVGLINEFD